MCLKQWTTIQHFLIMYVLVCSTVCFSSLSSYIWSSIPTPFPPPHVFDRSGRRKIEMLGYCLSPLVLFVYVGNAEIQWKVFCFKLVCLTCLKLMDRATGLMQTKISVSTLHSAHITWCHCFLFNGRRAAGRERGREWLNPVRGNLPSTPTQFLDWDFPLLHSLCIFHLQSDVVNCPVGDRSPFLFGLTCQRGLIWSLSPSFSTQSIGGNGQGKAICFANANFLLMVLVRDWEAGR